MNLFRITLLLDIIIIKIYKGIAYFVDILLELFYSYT